MEKTATHAIFQHRQLPGSLLAGGSPALQIACWVGYPRVESVILCGVGDLTDRTQQARSL